MLDLFEDVLRESRGRHDARERAEAQDPASQRPVIADAQPQEERAVLALDDLLRAMPLALLHVIRRTRVNFDLNQLRATSVHAEGVGERLRRERPRLEVLVHHRKRPDTFDRERARF